MKSLILFVIFFLQLIRESKEINCEFSGNCNVELNVAEIICPRSSSCTCKPDSDPVCTTLLGDTPKYDDITAATCRDVQCTAANCQFWKYLVKKENLVSTKHCYLMDDSQCASADDSVVCPEDNEHTGAPSCRSGVSPSTKPEDCEGGTIPTTIIPEPTTDVPTLKPCPGPIVEGDGANVNQEWTCFNGHGAVDMYEEESMPAGGFCLLADRCNGQNSAISVRYDCIGTETEGTWTGSGSGTNDEIYVNSDTKALKEVGCKAEDLIMDNALVSQEGRLITCSNKEYVESSGKIEAENDCIMLCDMYPVFSFYTDFNIGEAGRGWFYELFDSPGSPEVLVAGMLDCWGKR